MASQSQGIQQLLQAEKRAAEKVAEARKREFFFWLRWRVREGSWVAIAIKIAHRYGANALYNNN